MKSPLSSTVSIASRTRGRSGAYCAFTSASGIRGTARKSRGTYPPVSPDGNQCQREQHHGDLDVAEVVMEALVAPARRPPDRRETERPDRRPDCREHDIAP